MGRCPSSDFSDYSDDSTCLFGQQDATANAGNLWSNSGADGCRSRRCVVGLSDVFLVGLSALVSADPVLVDLLGSISYKYDVEEGTDTRKYCDGGG